MLHVAVGLAWLAVMMLQVTVRTFSHRRATPAVLLLFWHALDIIWVWLFTVVYLMDPSVTDASYELAAGDHAALAGRSETKWSGLLIYTTGLIFAVGLTATSFWAANTSQLWRPGVALGLVVLAIAQMRSSGLLPAHHHRTDNTNNVLALAFGILIVTAIVTGSMWIMTDLGQMLPMSGGSMGMHMQHETVSAERRRLRGQRFSGDRDRSAHPEAVSPRSDRPCRNPR